MGKYESLGGQRFSRLVAETYLGRRKRVPYWQCRCDCGNAKDVSAYHLVRGLIQSCGCLRKDAMRAVARTHGDYRSKEYLAWKGMKDRCYNESSGQYQDYGGRGITVCPQWADSYQQFLADVGRAPSRDHSLDRIKVNGNYEPGNVRWSLSEIQANNKRNNDVLRYGDREMTLSQWAAEIGIPRITIRNRIRTLGWTVGQALGMESPPETGCYLEEDHKAAHSAHQAVRNAILSGRLRRGDKCAQPGCDRVDVRAHHHKGYARGDRLDVVWYCPTHLPKRNRRVITHGGQAKTIQDWAKEKGLTPACLADRIRRWGLERAMAAGREVEPQKPTRLDLTGQRFGKLVALRRGPRHGTGLTTWVCKCDCGKEATVITGNLRKGNSTTCGCGKAEGSSRVKKTHGQSLSPEYRVYRAMLNRCYNPKDQSYEDYGGRGIGVCDRWRESFQNFWDDMCPRPGKGYSLERIDTNSNYGPGEVIWATATQQSRNRRITLRVTYKGETLTLGEWAERAGVSLRNLYQRIVLRCWDVERAMTTPNDGK
jgi:hypothetical protein